MKKKLEHFFRTSCVTTHLSDLRKKKKRFPLFAFKGLRF